MLFDVFAGSHHQISHFVSNNHDEGEFFRDVSSLVFIINLQPTQHFIASKIVEAIDVPDSRFSQQRISFLHFVNGPRQDGFRLFHVCDHWMHQVRQPPIATEFNHFGVDHQHPHFVRPTAHQDRSDNRVQTNTLTGARSTSDQEVWHFREIDDHRISGDILPQENRDVHLRRPRV